MKQGEIWIADLNPVRGSEQSGIWPVVVISGNAMNNNLGVSIVCPLTTRLKGYSGCLVLRANNDNGLEADSEVIVFQVRTLAQDRLVRKSGNITSEQLALIKTGLSEILTY